MKRFLIAFVICLLLLFSYKCYAYNPNTFEDEETVSVQGNRPKVDIELSEITVNIEPEDFIDGVFEKTIIISNEGTVPCNITLEIQNVPKDLDVEATVDDDFLLRGESTGLNIIVTLTDQQDTESFSFTILVSANLK